MTVLSAISVNVLMTCMTSLKSVIAFQTLDDVEDVERLAGVCEARRGELSRTEVNIDITITTVVSR